jgi:IclR family pca regulon transcriptional regulator
MPRRTASSASAALRSAAPPAEPQTPDGPERPESPERPGYRVEALAKGLRILSLFDEQRPSWRVSDLATAAGLPMPTAYRVVMTLTAEGYLDHLPNGEYRPGVRTLTLGMAALRSLDLVGIATPKLTDLGQRMGETVNLAVLNGDRVLYLVRLRNSDLVTANIQVGSTLPAVHASIGKMLLAYLDEDELEARITDASFSASSGPNAKLSLAELRAELRVIRDQGWAMQDEELAYGPAAWWRASTWPCRPETGPPSGSSASSSRPCLRLARRSPRCWPAATPARHDLRRADPQAGSGLPR